MNIIALKMVTEPEHAVHEWKFRPGMGKFNRMATFQGSFEDIQTIRKALTALTSEKLPTDIGEIFCEISDDSGNIWTLLKNQKKTIFSLNHGTFANIDNAQELLEEIWNQSSHLSPIEQKEILIKHYDVALSEESIKAFPSAHHISHEDKIVEKWIKQHIAESLNLIPHADFKNWILHGSNLHKIFSHLEEFKSLQQRHMVYQNLKSDATHTQTEDIDLSKEREKLRQEISLISRIEDVLWMVQLNMKFCLTTQETDELENKITALESICGKQVEHDLGFLDQLLSQFSEHKAESYFVEQLTKLAHDHTHTLSQINQDVQQKIQKVINDHDFFHTLEKTKTALRKEAQKIETELRKKQQSFTSPFSQKNKQELEKAAKEEVKDLLRLDGYVGYLGQAVKKFGDEISTYQKELSLNASLSSIVEERQLAFHRAQDDWNHTLTEVNPPSSDILAYALSSTKILFYKKILAQNLDIKQSIKQKVKALEQLVAAWQHLVESQKNIVVEHTSTLLAEAKNIVRYKKEKIQKLSTIEGRIIQYSLAKKQFERENQTLERLKLQWDEKCQSLSLPWPAIGAQESQDILSSLEKVALLNQLRVALVEEKALDIFDESMCSSPFTTWSLLQDLSQLKHKQELLKKFEHMKSGGFVFFLVASMDLSSFLQKLPLGSIEKINKLGAMPGFSQKKSQPVLQRLQQHEGQKNPSLTNQTRVQAIVDILNGQKNS